MGLTVGLDVTPSLVGVSGLKNYSDATWEHLRARSDLDLRAFAAGRGGALGRPAYRVPVPLRALHASWRLLGWPRAETLCGRVDVVHSLDLIPPPTGARLVVTVMDVIAITDPQFCSPRTIRLQRQHLAGAERADIVVTGCESTADEIARVSRVPRDRIMVTPYGRKSASPVSHRRSSEYILSVSTIEARKGYEVLAAAVQMVEDCPTVVIAGPNGWQGDEIRARIALIDKRRLVRFIGNVTDAERLASLYAGAAMVCQPSLAEGFGFPIIEAMGYGAPVIATDIPQTREIGGDCVALVPPGDATALAEAIQRGLSDQAWRDEVARRGRARAGAYTWARTTDRLVEAYLAAAAS